MEQMLVQVIQIGNNVFQIIGKTDLDCEFTKDFLISMVAEVAEKAERNHGILQQDYVAHTRPTNIVVYATYMFLSGADIEAFLKEC